GLTQCGGYITKQIQKKINYQMTPHSKMTEDQFCAKAVQYIWNTYPQTRRLLQHIPNEAKRSKAEWVQLKAKGLIPGATDYIFLWNQRAYTIEAKDPDKGRISPEQVKVHEALKSQQIPVFIVYSDQEFIQVIESIINV